MSGPTVAAFDRAGQQVQSKLADCDPDKLTG